MGTGALSLDLALCLGGGEGGVFLGVGLLAPGGDAAFAAEADLLALPLGRERGINRVCGHDGAVFVDRGDDAGLGLAAILFVVVGGGAGGEGEGGEGCE